MLDITMKSRISVRLTLQIPTIICHHMNDNIKEIKKGRYKQTWGIRPKPMQKKKKKSQKLNKAKHGEFKLVMKIV